MLQDHKIPAFQKTHSMLDDDPSETMSAAELKAWWDSAPEQARVAFNAALDDIDALYALKSELNGVVLGQILDGSLTLAKLEPSIQTASIGGLLYAYKNFGGF